MTTPRFSIVNEAVTANLPALPDRFEVLTSQPAATAAPQHDWAFDAVAPNDVVLPQYYEAKYPYPLIVWLQPTGCRAPEVRKIMPALSERNYVGTICRLNLSLGNPLTDLHLGDKLPGAPTVPWNWVQDIRRDVLHVRRNYHIHSERIYLAGLGAGASAAIQLLLECPEWFAGAIALDPDLELAQVSLRHLPQLVGKRLFTTSVMRSQELTQLERLCYVAGMDINHKNYPTELSLHRKVLRDVDSWLMSEICQPQMV